MSERLPAHTTAADLMLSRERTGSGSGRERPEGGRRLVRLKDSKNNDRNNNRRTSVGGCPGGQPLPRSSGQPPRRSRGRKKSCCSESYHCDCVLRFRKFPQHITRRGLCWSAIWQTRHTHKHAPCTFDFVLAGMNSHSQLDPNCPPPAPNGNLMCPDSHWVVQKFGGTSVGKFALNIVDQVVLYAPLHTHRFCPLMTIHADIFAPYLGPAFLNTESQLFVLQEAAPQKPRGLQPGESCPCRGLHVRSVCTPETI